MSNNTSLPSSTTSPTHPANNLASDRVSTDVKIAMGVLIFVGIIPGIFGNLLVIVAIIGTTLRRSVVNLLVLSLAVTDVLISAFPLPILGVYFVFYWPEWMIGHGWCPTTMFVTNVCAIVSILTLISIAIDRYYAVQHNTFLLSRGRCKILMVVYWIVGALIAAANLMRGGIFQEKLQHGTYSVCHRITGRTVEDPSIKLSLIIKLSLGLPISIGLIIIYILLSYSVWKQRAAPTAEDFRSESVKRQRSNKNKAVKMMFAIVVAFALCWIPYYVVTFIRIANLSSDPNIDPGYVLFCYLLAMMNSTVNPILYALLSRKFRKVFKSILTGTKTGTNHTKPHIPTNNRSNQQ